MDISSKDTHEMGRQFSVVVSINRPLSGPRSTSPHPRDPAQSLYSASRLLHTAAAVRTNLRRNMSYFPTVRHKVLSLIESPRKAKKEAKLAAACMRGDI
jgi:hypothetical protein